MRKMRKPEDLGWPCRDFIEDKEKGWCVLMFDNGSCKKSSHFMCPVWILARYELQEERNG